VPNKYYKMTRSVINCLSNTASRIVNQFLLATDTSAPFNLFFSGGLRLLLTGFRELLPETCWLTVNITTRICVIFQWLSSAAFLLPPTRGSRASSTILAHPCNCIYVAAVLCNRCWFLGDSEQDRKSEKKINNFSEIVVLHRKHSVKFKNTEDASN